jgi:hypothetical protein
MAKDFTDLVAWQLADELRRLVFEITARSDVREVQDLLIDGHERGFVTSVELSRGLRLVVRSKSACAALARFLLTTPDPE